MPDVYVTPGDNIACLRRDFMVWCRSHDSGVKCLNILNNNYQSFNIVISQRLDVSIHNHESASMTLCKGFFLKIKEGGGIDHDGRRRKKSVAGDLSGA
jgi:hypothetical protein